MTDKRQSPAVLIFAGTTEGRLLAEYASEKKIPCYVSTATEYGKSLLTGLAGIETISGKIDEEQICRFLSEKQIRLVVDATHPFAVLATSNISHACQRCGAEYIRCLREKSPDLKRDKKYTSDPESSDSEGVIPVLSVKAAAEYLKGTSGNILIATGSKELRYYTEIPGYRERCFARVLSTKEAVEESIALGFKGRHLIAMQGPFSTEMNLALLKQVNAKYFVTKDSGKAGGFEQKITAAEKAGAVSVIVGRPPEKGESVESVEQKLAQFGKTQINL